MATQQRDIVRNFQSFGEVPSGLVDDKDRVGSGRNSDGDFLEMQVHGFGVAFGQHQRRADAPSRADGTEDIG